MFKICFVSIFIFVIFSNYVNASNLDPEKILDGVDDLYRSNSSHGIITLSVTTVNWKRTLTLEQWSKGEDKSLFKSILRNHGLLLGKALIPNIQPGGAFIVSER